MEKAIENKGITDRQTNIVKKFERELSYGAEK